jgi:hypothetical protein
VIVSKGNLMQNILLALLFKLRSSN